MRHDHERACLLELAGQLLNHQRRHRVECRGRLVHQQNVGLHGKRAGDAQALLLSTRKTQARLFELVLDLVPQGSATQGVLDQLIEHDAVTHSHAARTVRDVVVDAHGKRVGALKHHAHALAQTADVVIAQDILTIERNLALDAAILDAVVHAVKAAQQR